MTTEHTHRFNATLVHRKGRCACGAWAARSGKAWVEITHTGSVKGLETRLRRAKDPSIPYRGPIDVPNVNEDMPEGKDYEAL